MSAVQTFRKRPVEIQAMQFCGTAITATEIIEWVVANGGCARFKPYYEDEDVIIQAHLAIDTLEGTMAVMADSWVVRGVQGEFYPCKPDIFAATYEEVKP